MLFKYNNSSNCNKNSKLSDKRVRKRFKKFSQKSKIIITILIIIKKKKKKKKSKSRQYKKKKSIINK